MLLQRRVLATEFASFTCTTSGTVESGIAHHQIQKPLVLQGIPAKQGAENFEPALAHPTSALPATQVRDGGESRDENSLVDV